MIHKIQGIAKPQGHLDAGLLVDQPAVGKGEIQASWWSI